MATGFHIHKEKIRMHAVTRQALPSQENTYGICLLVASFVGLSFRLFIDTVERVEMEYSKVRVHTFRKGFLRSS
jgi:hypothetical protein